MGAKRLPRAMKCHGIFWKNRARFAWLDSRNAGLTAPSNAELNHWLLIKFNLLS